MTNLIPGKVAKRFRVKGDEIILRYPRWEDMDDLMRHINLLVEEKSYIGMSRKVSRKLEIVYFLDMFKKLETRQMIYLVMETKGEVIGSCTVERGRHDANRHTGMIGVSIKKGFRGMGIGTESVNTLVDLGKRDLGIKVFNLEVSSGNRKAISMYEKKCGFSVAGRIPKGFDHFGKKTDAVIMYREK